MKASINNTLLRQLEAKSAAYQVCDIKLKGFTLRIYPSGRMVYRCNYGRGKFITIGDTGLFTPAQARDKAKKILGQSSNGIDPGKKKNKRLTLSEYIQNEYAKWREVNRKDAKHDLQRLKIHFLNGLGDLALRDISLLALEKWRSKRLEAGIKAVTINRDVATLKTSLARAEEWGLIETNPLAKLKPLKIDDLPSARYLQKDEETRLRQALDIREREYIAGRESANQWRQQRDYTLFPVLNTYYLKAMVLLVLNTGLRRKDLFTLSQKYIDLDNRTITILGGIAKTERTRHIPLNSEAFSAISNWLAQVSVIKSWWQQNLETNPLVGEKILKADLLFFNDQGEQFTDIKKSWKHILSKAEISNFRFHDLRHHFASKLVMAGIDLNTVRELLGHSDIKMTLRYAHLAPEHKAKAVEKLVGW